MNGHQDSGHALITVMILLMLSSLLILSSASILELDNKNTFIFEESAPPLSRISVAIQKN